MKVLLTLLTLAVQDCLICDHIQSHVHGQFQLTDEAVPAEQRFVVGLEDTMLPLALQHVPIRTASFDRVLQEAVVPPFDHIQFHVHTHIQFSRTTDEAVPAEQRSIVGIEDFSVLLAFPHTPLVDIGPDVTFMLSVVAAVCPFAS